MSPSPRYFLPRNGRGEDCQTKAKRNRDLKIVLVVVGVLIVLGVALELVSCVITKRSRERFDKMSPEEQRKYQEKMYKPRQIFIVDCFSTDDTKGIVRSFSNSNSKLQLNLPRKEN